MSSQIFPEDPFWDFSLSYYAKNSVREACLALQDKFRCDVNIVLFCCWCGSRGQGVLDRNFIIEAAQAVAPWNDDVIKHLRVTRWVAGGGFDEIEDAYTGWLHDRIASVELDAEHVEQLMLSALVDAHAPAASACGPSAVARNLLTYLRWLEVEQNDVADEALGKLLQGLFDSVSERSARDLLVWL